MPEKGLTVHHITDEEAIALDDSRDLCQDIAEDIRKVIRAQRSLQGLVDDSRGRVCVEVLGIQHLSDQPPGAGVHHVFHLDLHFYLR